MCEQRKVVKFIQTTFQKYVEKQKQEEQLNNDYNSINERFPKPTHKHDNIILKVPFNRDEYQQINEVFVGNPLEEPKYVYLGTLMKGSFMELLENTKNNQYKRNHHDFILNNEVENKLQVILYTWEKIGKEPINEERLFQKLILNEWVNNSKFYEFEQPNFDELMKRISGKVNQQ